MFDIYAALSGGMIANLLLTILGLVISVAAGILLYWKVFGPKAKIRPRANSCSTRTVSASCRFAS